MVEVLCLFEMERQFSPDTAHQIVASDSAKLSQEQHLRDVYEIHRQRVFAVSYYMTASEPEAETILTSTFVTAFSTQKYPDGNGVDRALVGELGKRFLLAPEPHATPDTSASLAGISARRTDMEEALNYLPPLERLVFLLRDVEGYTAAKVAALLEVAEPEVQRTLLSARIRIRNTLAAARVTVG